MTISAKISRRGFGVGLGTTALVLGSGLSTTAAFATSNGPRIDGHLHFWKPSNSFHGWPGENLTSIYRDILPSDAEPLLSNSGMDGVVVVEAAMNLEETEWLLELAAANPMIKKVSGWAALDDVASVGHLAKFAENPVFGGTRSRFLAHENSWIDNEIKPEVIDAFIAHNLTLDILYKSENWPSVEAFLSKYPDLKVVLNHGGRPVTKNGVDHETGLAGWSSQVDAWAAHPNTFMKFSGFISSAASKDATYDTFKPYFDKLWSAFGAERLIYATDWPAVTLLRGDTLEVWTSICWAYLNDIEATEAERDAFLGGTAVRAYNI